MAITIFHCPHCAGALRNPQGQRVALMECGHCRQIVSPPGVAVEPLAPLPHQVLALELSFLCYHCQNRLRIDARYENREIQCGNCRQQTPVPGWSHSANASPSLRGADLSPAEVQFLTEAFANGHPL